MRLLPLVLVGVLVSCADLPSSSASDSLPLENEVQNLDFCGPARQGSTFAVKHGGHTYRLLWNVQIDRDRRTVHRDGEPKAWQPPRDGVIFFGIGRSLLIEVTWSDCVDLYSSRLFVIGPESQVTERQGLTSHWRGGFLHLNSEVVYWSEWFCYPQNERRRNGRSFVLAFSEQNQEFEQRDVDDAIFCDRRDQLPLMPWLAANEEKRPDPN